VAEVALNGRFVQIPEVLLYRDNSNGAWRSTLRSKMTTFDPRRANRLLHPAGRIYAEYAMRFFTSVARAPLPAAEKARCYGHLLARASIRLLERVHLKQRKGHGIPVADG
jgi:hypothetical protein